MNWHTWFPPGWLIEWSYGHQWPRFIYEGRHTVAVPFWLHTKLCPLLHERAE